MRHLSILILAVACAGSSGTQLPSPLDSDERKLLGCYRVAFVGQEHGAPFRWGATWAPAEVTLKLDSTPAWRLHAYVGHTATFVEGMPVGPDIDLKRAPAGWRRSADTVAVVQYAGIEGQGIRMIFIVKGDSLVGYASWGWTTDPKIRRTGPLNGVRTTCG